MYCVLNIKKNIKWVEIDMNIQIGKHLLNDFDRIYISDWTLKWLLIVWIYFFLYTVYTLFHQIFYIQSNDGLFSIKFQHLSGTCAIIFKKNAFVQKAKKKISLSVFSLVFFAQYFCEYGLTMVIEIYFLTF